MVDTNKLRAKMLIQGKTITDIADALGVSAASVYNRFNGSVGFGLDDAETICEVLGINDPAEKGEIFFAKE